MNRIVLFANKTIVCKRVRIALSLALCAMAFSSVSADIVISYDLTNSLVWQEVPYNFDEEYLENTGGVTATASFPGFSCVTTTLFGNSVFSATFAQSRLGGFNDYSSAYTSAEFMVTSDVSYLISGSYTNGNGYSYLAARLEDVTSNTWLMDSYQYDFGGGTLYLGGLEGEFYDFTGSLSGTLQAGHSYSWFSSAMTQVHPDPDGGDAATGSTLLQFGVSVPEPGSIVLLCGMTLVILVGVWRRKRIPSTVTA